VHDAIWSRLAMTVVTVIYSVSGVSLDVVGARDVRPGHFIRHDGATFEVVSIGKDSRRGIVRLAVKEVEPS
jgi:hypothetical protein